MINKFLEVTGSSTWKKINLIDKGWSNDKKYCVITDSDEYLLLRISDIKEYDIKEIEFNSLKLLDSINNIMSRPIEFGICNNGKNVFMLLTWIKGEDADKKILSYSLEKQYQLGFEAGEILKKIHSISIKKNNLWENRFNLKIDKKILTYEKCSVKFNGSEDIINYINKNRYLLKNRIECFQHGDYHLSNMIITEDDSIGIIDFNRFDYGDPWEEFNRITWCVDVSPEFASGRINGYFDNKVPLEFFKLLGLYIGSNQLSSVPWAINFGQKQIDVMLNQVKNVLRYYDNFKSIIPSWYVEKEYWRSYGSVGCSK